MSQNGNPPKVPTVEELKKFMTGEAGNTPDGDLTPEAFTAIQSLKSPVLKETKVLVTDDAFVAMVVLIDVGGVPCSSNMKMTPDETTKLISLLMGARAEAVRLRKLKG